MKRDKHAMQPPPHDLVAEVAVLGSMMMADEPARAAMRALTAAQFYSLQHRDIFEAACRLLDRDEPVDIVTLRDELHEADKLEGAGGQTYLLEVCESPYTSTNVEHYVRIVQENAVQRNLLQIFRDSQDDVHRGVLDWSEFNDRIGMALATFRGATIDVPRIGAHVAAAAERMERRARGEDTGLKTGLGPVDRTIGGFEPGEFVLVMGESSSGKTALTSNVLLNITLDQKRPALFFSAEVIGPTLAIDLARIIGGRDLWRLDTTGRLSPEDYAAWQDAQAQLGKAPLFVDDTTGISIEELVSRATRIIEEHAVELIAVDYVQLLTTEKSCESEVLRLDYIGRKLKTLAGRHRVPVMALSQMTITDGRRDPRYCKSLMHHCDIRIDVLRANRAYDKEPENEPDDCRRKVVVAKGRHKGTGWSEMGFHKPTLRFYELDGEER